MGLLLLRAAVKNARLERSPEHYVDQRLWEQCFEATRFQRRHSMSGDEAYELATQLADVRGIGGGGESEKGKFHQLLTFLREAKHGLRAFCADRRTPWPPASNP